MGPPYSQGREMSAKEIEVKRPDAITSRGKYYVTISTVGVMGIKDLDHLRDQGLELVSENRVVDPGCWPKKDDVWHYIFRNQRQPHSVGS